ncbi:UMP kinase [Candidatus Woesearchaeota archaeon]|nr:UMP kinase [Candidatus Woesearchaeota archaeon]
MKNTVMSVGGSLLVPNGIDAEYIGSLKQTLTSYESSHRLFLVAGGGRTAGQFIEAAEQVRAVAQEDLDWLGIHATRLNAHLLRTVFRESAHPEIITDPTRRLPVIEPVCIAAGWRPGWSTDYVAVQVARTYGSNMVINLTNTDYAFDKDPNKFCDASPLEDITWSEFLTCIPKEWKPRMNAPFDPIASRAASEFGMTVIIANGANLLNLEHILTGREYVGTTIYPDGKYKK